MKKYLFKFYSGVTVLSLLYVLAYPGFAMAASVTSFSDVLTRTKASTLANHTITFTTPTGIAGGATLILTFDNSTSIAASLDYTDIDLADDGVDVTLAAAPSGATWGVVRTSGTVITFTNGSSAVAAGSVVTIEIGTNATTGTTGDQQITNGPAGTTTLVLSGTFGDSGTTSMAIVNDDQVSVSATVNQTITFDIDTATTDAESASPYSVALGTITTTDTRVSGTTDSVNYIWLDLNTNASGGINVVVKNANGANGLKSTSTPADDIGSTDGTMADGTENYGLCVVAVSQTTGTLSKAAPYNAGSCAGDSETNAIQGLTTTGENIVASSAPLGGGRAQIAVNAAISGSTPAHSDYADTLTFTATSTF